jgi:hypothetical protein
MEGSRKLVKSTREVINPASESIHLPPLSDSSHWVVNQQRFFKENSMDQVLGMFFAGGVLWIAFCGTMYIVNSKWAVQLAWWPLRLTRRAIGWAFIELGRIIGGGKK